MPGEAIFISYRRTDTGDACGRIYDRLVAAFGQRAIFMDIATIPYGSDFGDTIREVLAECCVVLAMIGPAWVSTVDAEGQKRLDKPDDWVRRELELALQHPSATVVPVLVSGAALPEESDLPPSLAGLRRLHSASVRRNPDFHADMDRLIEGLTPTLEAAKASRKKTTVEQVWTHAETKLREHISTIRTLIAEAKLDDADRALGEARFAATAVLDLDPLILAELTGLAGNSIAAANRVGSAKWLWRLALQRFTVLNSSDHPAAVEFRERLTAASS